MGFPSRNSYKFNFPLPLINLILFSLTSAFFSILWNDIIGEAFHPERGLRQGCPLSPYLFVLCLEHLTRMIERLVQDQKWKPITLSRCGIPISHLFFADDMHLFAETSIEKIETIMACLHIFCAKSGEVINVQKSQIYFSHNVHTDLRSQICNLSKIQETKEIGRYLGVQILSRCDSKTEFAPLVTKIKTALQKWKGNCLNFAGRVTLAKSVLAAIPAYTMQSDSLPVHICQEIDRITRSFVWNDAPDHRKIHLINWETMSMPKKFGGLGIRQTRAANDAFICKLACQFFTQYDTP